MVKSIERTAKKWKERVAVAGDEYKAGVENPTLDWESRASAAESRYENEIRAAISDKRFGKGIKKAGTAKWKDRTLAVGAARWGPGVDAAAPIFEAEMRDVLAFEDTLQKKVLAMPDATLEQRIARNNEWIRSMKAFKKK